MITKHQKNTPQVTEIVRAAYVTYCNTQRFAEFFNDNREASFECYEADSEVMFTSLLKEGIEERDSEVYIYIYIYIYVYI
jgi:hypothetical protein